MSAVLKEPSPLLDRIEAYMRDQPITREQGEVVKAFPSEPANVVRLALGALRRQGKLSHTLDDGKVFYIWIGEPAPRKPDAPTLRQAGTSLPHAARSTAPSMEQVCQALGKGDLDFYSAEQVCTSTGLNPLRVKKCLQALVNAGRIYADGKSNRRRYSIKPFENRDRLHRQAAEEVHTSLTEAGQSGLNAVLTKRIEVIRTTQTEPVGPGATGSAEPDPGYEPLSTFARDKTGRLNAIDLSVSRERLVFMEKGKPIAAMTADRRIVIVNGGQGTILDIEITSAVIDLIRKFDEAGPQEMLK